MSSSSLIMVHIAPCFQELWLFVHLNSTIWMVSKSSKVNHNFMKLGHNVRYQKVFFKFENGLFAIMSYCPLLMKNANFYDV